MHYFTKDLQNLDYPSFKNLKMESAIIVAFKIDQVCLKRANFRRIRRKTFHAKFILSRSIN